MTYDPESAKGQSQFLVDAFGGGRKPLKTPPSRSVRTKSRSPVPARTPADDHDDQDLPPTQSLHNMLPGQAHSSNGRATPLSARSSRHGSPMELDLPATPTPKTPQSVLTIIGFPPGEADAVVALLETLGQCQVVYGPSPHHPQDATWLVVRYNSPVAVANALQLDGRVMRNAWVLVVKKGDIINPNGRLSQPNSPLGLGIQVDSPAMSVSGDRRLDSPLVRFDTRHVDDLMPSERPSRSPTRPIPEKIHISQHQDDIECTEEPAIVSVPRKAHSNHAPVKPASFWNNIMDFVVGW